MTSVRDITNRWHELWAQKDVRFSARDAIDGAVREAIQSEQVAHGSEIKRLNDRIAQLDKALAEERVYYSAGINQLQIEVFEKSVEIDRMRANIKELLDYCDEADVGCYGTLSTNFIRNLMKISNPGG